MKNGLVSREEAMRELQAMTQGEAEPVPATLPTASTYQRLSYLPRAGEGGGLASMTQDMTAAVAKGARPLETVRAALGSTPAQGVPGPAKPSGTNAYGALAYLPRAGEETGLGGLARRMLPGAGLPAPASDEEGLLTRKRGELAARRIAGGMPTTATKMEPGGFHRDMNAQRAELEHLKEQRSLLRRAQGNRYEGAWLGQVELLPGETVEAALKRVEAEIAEKERGHGQALWAYYATENEEQFARMGQDPESGALYDRAGTAGAPDVVIGRVLAALQNGGSLEDDPASVAQIRERWGVSPEKSGSVAQYMNDLTALLGTDLGTVDVQKEAVEGLSRQGYDYGRMREYAQTKREAAEYARKREERAEAAREHPVLASAVSVLAAPLQGLDFLDAAGRALGPHGDDKDLAHYVPADPYRMEATNLVNTIRGTVAEEIEENTDLEIAGQNVAAFLYQTGMSVADSATQIAAFGPAATLFMGASAAANQAQDIMARGGTSRQAFVGGLAAGAAEAVFEKFSIDNLLSAKTIGSAKDLLRETVKQMGVEASEETFTEIANILSDAAIMGGSSSFHLAVEDYREQGMSEAEARQRAYLDCVGQVAWAGVGGAVSGGVMGGVRRGTQYLGGLRGGVEMMPGSGLDGEASGPYNGAKEADSYGRGEEGAVDPGILHGADVRGEDGKAGVYPGGDGAVSEAAEGARGGEGRAAGGKAVQGWAEGHLVQPATPSMVRAVEAVGAYVPDVHIVEDSALKGQNDKALALTSDGVIYLSDAIPENLSVSVPYHEVVHAAKQRGNGAYIDFVDTVGERLDVGGDPSGVLDIVIESRYPGKTLFDLSGEELDVVYDELNAVVWGFFKDDPENARAQFSGVFTDYDAYIAELDAIMEGAKGRPAQGAAGAAQTEEAPFSHMTPEERAMWDEAQKRKAQREAAGGQEEYRGTPATDKLGVKIERPITDLGASQSIRGIEKARNEAGQALNRLLKESFATEAERRVARGVADGVYTMETARRMLGVNMQTVSELAEVMRLVDSYDAKAIKEHQRRSNWDFDARVRELIRDSDSKTVPGTLSLNANTMQRNNERVWGKDAAAINAEIFDPVITNEARRIRFVNRMLGEMEQYHLTGAESQQVQRLMEQQITPEELRAAGYDADRLSAAAKALSARYADFYDAINDFLVAHGYREIGWQRNYAPHMQEEQVNTLQKYLQRMGFQTQVTELPTDLAGRTDAFRPGKQYDPYFQHRVGNKTVYDAVGGFESYVNYLSNVLFHTDDIQKLRRFSEEIRTKYSAEELGAELDRLNHLQDRPAGADAELLGDDIQAMKDAAFERYGRMTKFGGYVSVLDDYTNILAGKQSKFDRAVESLFGRKLLNAGRNIQNAFSRAAILGNLSSAINQTVQIPQLITELGPKYTVQAVVDVATGETGKTGFNQESDFLTGKTGIHGISEKSASERLFDVAAKPFEIVDDFASRVIVRTKYLEQVAAGKSHADALRAADQFAARLVGSRMRGAKPVLFEQKNPITKLVTTFQLEVANGWEHIVHDLPMEIRTIAETKGKPAAARRTAELVVASQVVNFLANLIIKSITGREPVPYDGLGMLANYMASGYGMTKEEYMKSVLDSGAEALTGERPLGTELPGGDFDLPAALRTGMEDIGEDAPYISNITSALGLTDGRLPLPQIWNSQLARGAKELWTAATAEEEEERRQAMEEGLPTALQGLGLAASTWLPMGSQIKKTAQGAAALARGGAYTGFGEEERLQYDVEGTPANWARGLLFGKSALPETDAYYAQGAPLLTADQTDVYQQLVEAGAEGKDAYRVIQAVRSTKKSENESVTMERIGALERSGLPAEQQATVYRGMLASDSEQELMSRLERSGADPAEVYRALVDIRRARDGKTGKTDAKKKLEAIRDAELSDSGKIVLYREKVSDSRDDDILAAVSAGLPFDGFLEAQIAYNDINGRAGLSAAEKRTEFARWLNSQLYTADQQEAMKEAFRFASFVPAGETTYEKLMGAGLPDALAYGTAGQLGALEPALGKTQVSSLQKSRVIVDSGADDGATLEALKTVMGESEYAKVETAYDYGVSPAVYVTYKEQVAGLSKQEDVEQVLRSLLITDEQRAALWQLQNTGWKPYKNPFSTAVSQRVYEAYQGRKTSAEAEDALVLRYGGGGQGMEPGEGRLVLRYGGGGSQKAATPTGEGGLVLRYGGSAQGMAPTLPGGGTVSRYGAGAQTQQGSPGVVSRYKK